MIVSKRLMRRTRSSSTTENAKLLLARSHCASRFVALLLTGLLLISVQTGLRAGWIAAKAGAAQILLVLAWEKTKQLQRPTKPWPWMDTYPVAKLTIPNRDKTLIVLNGSSGEAMAFGPSQIRLPSNPISADSTANREETKTASLVAIGGHRDTHLRFLQTMKIGDIVSLETADKQVRQYILESAQIVDTDKQDFYVDAKTPGLLLVTCYPFDALTAGGPLRLIAFAREKAEGAATETSAAALKNSRRENSRWGA